ncbi:MAG: branched-chain amino acid ABC transporter permease [Pseudomonadota bacterium]|nr:branched-chain amino acid ABC transporter permease [Pseudomonadota bacterium]
MTAYPAALLTLIAVNAMLALSLNLITGLCRQVSLGHAAFACVGAYATALLAKAGYGVWMTVPASVLLAALMGLLVGVGSIRIRDDFLAIATMGINFLIVGIVRTNDALGGELGISQIAWPDGAPPLWIIACTSMVLVCAACWWIKRSWLGFVFVAVGTDEAAARSLGIDASRYKVAAFAIGTGLAGLAGCVYAYYLTSVGPDAFGFPVSVMILATVVIGGMGSLGGSVLAALLLTLLPESIRFVNDYKLLVFGLLLFATVRLFPRGLYPALVEAVGRWSRTRTHQP